MDEHRSGNCPHRNIADAMKHAQEAHRLWQRHLKYWPSTDVVGIEQGQLASSQLDACLAQDVPLATFLDLFSPSKPSPFED